MPTICDCLTCEDKPHFELHADMVKHLTEKHNVIVGQTSYKRQRKMCLDGANGWHQQIHEMDFGEFKIQETWTSK